MTAVEKIRQGDFYPDILLAREDEFKILGNAISTMAMDLNDYQKKALINAQTQKEVEIARHIQTSMVPDLKDDLDEELTFCGLLKPAENVKVKRRH